MSEQAPGNPLYEAAVGFLVSEKSETNAWEQVAKFVASFAGDYATLRREFRIVEQQVKKDFEVTRLPASWRSAKSTALNAVTKGIPLLGTDGTAVPKTDVGKLLKAAKSGVSVTPMDQFVRAFNTMGKMYLTLTGKDKKDADTMLLGFTAPIPTAPAGAVPAMAGS